MVLLTLANIDTARYIMVDWHALIETDMNFGGSDSRLYFNRIGPIFCTQIGGGLAVR